MWLLRRRGLLLVLTGSGLGVKLCSWWAGQTFTHRATLARVAGVGYHGFQDRQPNGRVGAAHGWFSRNTSVLSDENWTQTRPLSRIENEPLRRGRYITSASG